MHRTRRRPTYFTLLAQGRLVDAHRPPIFETHSSEAASRVFFPLPVVASKCGIYSGYIHDCAWIQDADVRYVIAVLSKRSTPGSISCTRNSSLNWTRSFVKTIRVRSRPVCLDQKSGSELRSSDGPSVNGVSGDPFESSWLTRRRRERRLLAATC